MCSETCLREIRCTLSGQRFDSVRYHLQVKQEPIGTGGIAESLEGSDVGAGQRHTVFREVEHFAVPFEDLECLRQRAEHRVLFRLSRQLDWCHPDFQGFTRTYGGPQCLCHELTAKTDTDDGLAGQDD